MILCRFYKKGEIKKPDDVVTGLARLANRRVGKGLISEKRSLKIADIFYIFMTYKLYYVYLIFLLNCHKSLI
ncbi:hypothetical protein JT31_08090 [Cedecea neteri]|uniref:Uncharacterized protein n=1 Tax=Cedecea neteri TaxID=158822 RepID=A0A089Q018_9ENTR|nr:hypothetical protein JT31_08090 [Cedecea neteri]